jgi:hypothetical protein
MNKVLITGFKHSGTTLLHQLIDAHPQVGHIENEKNLITYDKPVEWVLLFASKYVNDLKKNMWGEKIPYGKSTSDDENKAIEMITKWIEYFKEEARVIHIVRHPIDVVLSGTLHRISYKQNDLDFILRSVPKVIDFTNPINKCATLVYEDLVSNPSYYLLNIFSFLGLNTDNETIKEVVDAPELKFNKINSDRAFAFKKKGIDDVVDYDKIKVNVKYKL